MRSSIWNAESMKTLSRDQTEVARGAARRPRLGRGENKVAGSMQTTETIAVAIMRP